ncbi:MAG: phosphotransferase [Solirubrobacteraceae bacterium]|nr:phosphotransferase [Solirubrobacteraceae bacterium]
MMHLMEAGPGETGPVRGRELVERAEALAQVALRRYDFSPRTTVEVINLAENVTLRIDDPVNDERAVMRLHRPGYHHLSDIKSELQWLDALKASRTVEVPPPIDAINGDRVVIVEDDEGPRNVTVCGWLDGEAPDPEGDLVAQFATLGAVTARLHAHVAHWRLPPGFCRRPWGAEQMLGARPTFGPWRAGLGLDREVLLLLERAECEVKRRLASFSTGPESFGLVHADLRLANLLVDDTPAGQVVRVIDFDDCGNSWLMYDFGAAVSFIEDDPRLPELMASWCDGYRTVRSLPEELEAQIETFVMLRRLVLVGWVAKNHETATEAAELGAAFTAGTAEVAERYLGHLLV